MTPGFVIALKRVSRLLGGSGNETDTMGRVSTRGTPPRSIRIADDVWTPAAELAERLGETLSDVVRESLVGYVELHTERVWAEAVAMAVERGDHLPDILHRALEDYIGSD